MSQNIGNATRASAMIPPMMIGLRPNRSDSAPKMGSMTIQAAQATSTTLSISPREKPRVWVP
ncbi:hypothetical protein D3C76_1822670 [compost metagenome]